MAQYPPPYSVGSDNLPGLAKVVEEAGELLQVAGKILAVGGTKIYYDGLELRKAVKEEMADVIASISFFVETAGFTPEEQEEILNRATQKRILFREWQESQKGSEPE
jgi:NTP pyrophosphatase (non-canonical NTP hydrolase)